MGSAKQQSAVAEERVMGPERRRLLFPLMGQVFITMLGTAIVGPVLPLYAQSFAVTAAVVGLVVTAFSVARIIMNIPAGTLSEKFGRRPLLIVGPLISSLAALLSGLATHFWALVAFRFLQGIGSAAQTTAAMSALADISDDASRGRVMSLYQGSLLLGSSVGPAVGGFAAEYWGYRGPFFAYSALALLGAIWAFATFSETKGARDETAPPHATRKRMTTESAPRVHSTAVQLLTDRSFILVCLVTLAIFFTRTGSRSTIIPLLGRNKLGLGPGQLGVTFTIISLFNLATITFSGILCDRYGRKTVIVPSSIVSGMALVAFALSGNYAGFLVSGVLLGIGTGLAGPAPAAYVADIAPRGSYGFTMGLYRTFGDVGASVGPVLLGWLSDLFGYEAALLANAALFIVSAGAFGLFARETAGRRRAMTHP